MRSVLAIIAVLLFVVVLGIAACTPQQTAPVEDTEKPVPQEPTKEAIKVEADTTEEQVGEEQTEEEQAVDIPEDVQKLFDKAAKVTSLEYGYYGPETDGNLYEYYIRDNFVRIVLEKGFKDPHLDEDGYNAIYIDTNAKTSEAYCDINICLEKGKKRSLSYNEFLINTPLDWMNEITQAEKAGEELLNKRKVWKLDTNVGTVYMDSYTGMIMKVEQDDDIEYDFVRIDINNVDDEELRPLES